MTSEDRELDPLFHGAGPDDFDAAEALDLMAGAGQPHPTRHGIFDALSERPAPSTQPEPPPPPPPMSPDEQLAAIRACMPSQLDAMFRDFTEATGNKTLPPDLAGKLPPPFVQLFSWWADVEPLREVNPRMPESFRRFLLLCDALRVRTYTNVREKIDALSSAFTALVGAHNRVRIRPAIDAVLYLVGDSALPLTEDAFDRYMESSPDVRTDALLSMVCPSFLDWLLNSSEDAGHYTDSSENAQVLKRLQREISGSFMEEVALPSIAYLKAMDSVAMTVDDLTTAFESDRSGSEQLLAIALRLVEANKIARLLMPDDPKLADLYLDIVKQNILREGAHPPAGDTMPAPVTRSLAETPARGPGPHAPSPPAATVTPPRNSFRA